jgi:outer membrane lipoprotein-sorting protein
MKRIAIALALTLCAPAAWAAEKLSLNEISAYLNGVKTAKAAFTQQNDDGSVSSGTLYLSRPGKMRFEYDDQAGTTVVAGAGAVIIFDPKSNQPPETYPLKRTPLSIILARTVNLAQANMVTGHGFDGQQTIVRAQDPEHPEYGFIEMRFAGSTPALTGWVIHDGAGGQTRVELENMETGMTLSRSLFNTSVANPDR